MQDIGVVTAGPVEVQVLSHTAGIQAGLATDAAQDDKALERRIASLASTDLGFPPGGGYEYSNHGYSVRAWLCSACRVCRTRITSRLTYLSRCRWHAARSMSHLQPSGE